MNLSIDRLRVGAVTGPGRHWTAPPAAPDDKEKARRADLLKLVITNCLFLMALIMLALVLGDNPMRSMLIAMSWLGVLILGWRLLQSGWISLVTFALPIAFFVFLTAANICLGTIRTPTAAIYLFWVILVGMLFRLPGIVISTVTSSLTVLGLILAENASLLPQPDYSVGVTQWMVYTVLFALTASTVFHSNRMTEYALARAESEIEKRKRTENELRKLTRAVEQSRGLIVITDLDGTIEYVNPRFTMVTGYSLDEVVGKNTRMLKSDQTAPDTYRQLWARVTAGGEWRGEFVNRKKDGSLYHESAVISPITDCQGVVTHYLAVAEDVTQRKRLDEALRNSEARHRLLADNARDVIWTLSPDGRMTYVSPSVALVRGFAPEEAMRQTLDDILTPASQVIVLRYFAKLRASVAAGKPPESFKAELEYLCQDGATIWTEVMAYPLFSDAGLVEILGVTRDISERKRLLLELKQAKDGAEAANRALQRSNAELTRIATTDPLTGVWNRRHFEQVAAAESRQARRYQQPVSMVLFDIDHFKSVNDRHGHPAGDRVLIELSRLIQHALRQTDVLARWGGEEFVVIMSHCSGQQALQLAEKLRALVAAHRFPELGAVTASFGVAELGRHETLDAWFQRLDQALYAAKASGRNAVRLAS